MTSSHSASDATPAAASRRWLYAIGPGLITACVVIGPGSILTSSNVGATYGYSMHWLVVASVLAMMVYVTLAAKLGVAAGESTATLISQRAGRWLAVLIGASVFFISAAFQFGNNVGLRAALAGYEEQLASVGLKLNWLVVLFNVLAISFLFAFRNLYRAVERLMMTFVAIMLISFAINLGFARPSILEFLAGISMPWRPWTGGMLAGFDLSLMGLVGTTFVISAAYYQSYLVRQKGWTKVDLPHGLIDARIGALIMAAITLMLISTSAAVLRGKQLENIRDVAEGLRPAFGDWGHLLFCVGLFCAAYSSFLVNSMIGGFILADSLKLGSKPADLGPKLLTVLVLLVGMGVALTVLTLGWEPVPIIVAAQAVTVFASPLVAGALWWLTNRQDIMGEERNGVSMNVAAAIGFILLLGVAWNTAVGRVGPEMQRWLEPWQGG